MVSKLVAHIPIVEYLALDLRLVNISCQTRNITRRVLSDFGTVEKLELMGLVGGLGDAIAIINAFSTAETPFCGQVHVI